MLPFCKGPVVIKSVYLRDFFIFEVVESLLPFMSLNKEIQELQHILRKPHLKVLLTVKLSSSYCGAHLVECYCVKNETFLIQYG